MDVSFIKDKASALGAECAELRHHLHAHPELSWQELETSRLIESRLRELGFENVKRGFGGTECGVTADLIGDPGGPCVALRADIDALPVQEENDLVYRSSVDNTMHACGHDGHAAVLLCVSKLLASIKESLPGRVRVIFQPAEEHGLKSGAAAMIEGGVLDGVGAIAGLHLWSFVPTGRVQWRSGPMMSAVAVWSVKFIGKGGHGGMPHTAIDPTIAAGVFISSLQTIVSREIAPSDTAVVSVGVMTAGDAVNVIPTTAEVRGNIRSFTPEVRKQIEESLPRIADGIAAAHRCKAEVSVRYIYLSVDNHAAVTEVLRKAAVKMVGEERVDESPMQMVSEDFSFYQEKVPGTFFFVGCGNKAKGTDFPHHSPRFNVDDDALPTAIGMASCFACDMLERLKTGKL